MAAEVLARTPEQTRAKPSRWLERGLLLLAFGGVTFGAGDAKACDATNPERYRSDKTVWCVDPTVWTQHRADVERYFPFGDQVVVKLQEIFAVSPTNLPYSIVARTPDGYAQTPTRYGPGVEVTGDAFYNSFSGVQGFYGYLLVLHEFVNQWTGLVTGGWPTDWWADHRSPFPNAMDELILRELGQSNAASVQHTRMQGDRQVQMFLGIYQRPGYGFDGYRRAFTFIRQDGLNWGELRDPPGYTQKTVFVSGNPSLLLSEYVIAFISLGGGADLTTTFTSAGVGTLKPDSWTTPPWQNYTPTAQAVGDIADAHCSLAAGAAAGVNVTTARAAFRKGNYQNALVQGYDCAMHCPAECACASGSGRCVAPWRGDARADAGAGTGGAGGASGAGGSGIGGSSGSAGSTSTGGAAGTGGAPGTGGVPSTGGGPGSDASGGRPAAGGSGQLTPPKAANEEGGCGCRTPSGSRQNEARSLLLGLLGLSLIVGRRKYFARKPDRDQIR